MIFNGLFYFRFSFNLKVDVRVLVRIYFFFSTWRGLRAIDGFLEDFVGLVILFSFSRSKDNVLIVSEEVLDFFVFIV